MAQSPGSPFQNDPVFEDCRGDNVFIHESAYVDTPCRIGDNSSILHFTHVMSHAIIGENSHVGHNVTIGNGVMIGNSVRVMNNSLLNSGVILEDHVYCGASTIFNPLNRMKGHQKSLSRISPTLVKQGATIGPNTTVASGVLIGQSAFLEAGTVVDGNVPDFALMLGNPMKLVGWRCFCGEALHFKQRDTVSCDHCGKCYYREHKYRIVQQPDSNMLHNSQSQCQ